MACFWPFGAPKNGVSWIAGGRGIAFGKHGVLIGSGPLRPHDIAESGCTLDLWVEPEQADGEGAILATYSPGNSKLLMVEQSEEDLGVLTFARGGPVRAGGAQLYADGILATAKPILLTVTSNSDGTKVFVNGIFVKARSKPQICHSLLTGKLIVGTAAESHYSWRGRLRGIAIFSRPLSAEEVQDDYSGSPNNPSPALGNKAGLVALYPFDEGSGRRVRDLVSGANSLYIPDRYLVVAQQLLSRPSFDNPSDIIFNIIGFIPLGFTLCGYLCSRWGRTKSVVLTVLLCGLFSLLIETLQWFLPTRDSDMTDVITNVIGAISGVLLYRLSYVWLGVPLRKATR